jgi:CheY-like chemotaxis protein
LGTDVMEHTHIVVVNDSPEFLELMADLLHDHAYAATVIDGDRENAVDLVRAAEPDGLVVDLRLGRDELHGWELFHQIRSHPDLSELPTVVCSGDIEALKELEQTIADMPRVAMIQKPFTIDEMFATLDRVLAREPA